jgi:hypothetical protein
LKPQRLAVEQWPDCGLALARLAMACAILSTTGCYTTTNVATVVPLKTQYPVSASPSYVDQAGAVVGKEQYDVVSTFRFHRTVEGPRHDETKAVLALEPDLDGWMRRTEADAITNLKVEAVEYDSGSHFGAAVLKGWGWVFTVGGAVGLGVGIAADLDRGPRTRVLVGSAGVLGLGVLCQVLGAVANTPSRWEFEVSGQMVKRSTAPGTQGAQPIR